MKTYFITGATGFLGGRATELFLSQGHRVIAYGRNQTAGERLQRLGATFIRGDLNDRKLLESSLPEGVVVVHCAALSSPWGTPKEFYEANVLGTKNVAEISLKKRVKRFIHISTPSIYVDLKNRENISEKEPLPKEMINLYARTKLDAENEIDRLFNLGLPVISLRPQGIFGPGDQTLMPRIIRVAQKGSFPKIGLNQVKIDLTYVDNVVDAIVCAEIAEPTHLGKKYNISNGEPVLQHETMKKMLKALGFEVKDRPIPFRTAWNLARVLEFIYRTLKLKGEPLLTRYSVCVLSFTRTLDITAARTDLGYTPKISFSEGLQRYLEWSRHG